MSLALPAYRFASLPAAITGPVGRPVGEPPGGSGETGELATRCLCVHSCGAPGEWPFLYTTRAAYPTRCPRSRAAQGCTCRIFGAAVIPDETDRTRSRGN